MSEKFLQLNKNYKIAYNQLKGDKNKPGIIFLGGFRSDMTGVKAIALEKFARANKLDFIRFDYRGHGKSSGKFEDFCISDWRDDALNVLDKLAKGPQILVGSSMGGWVMLLAALKMPKRICALMGIAAAPDFTEYLIWDKFTKKQKAEIKKKGVIHIPSDYCDEYPITMKLIEDGRKNLLLHRPINLNIPIKLIHGMQDADVPYQTSLKISDMVTSEDVDVTFKKDGQHRMSEREDLELINQSLSKLLTKFS